MKTNEFIDLLNQIDSKSKTYFEVKGELYNFTGIIYVSNPFKSNKILLEKSEVPLDIENIKKELEDKNKSYKFKFLSNDATEKYEYDSLKISKRPKMTKIILV